MKKITAKRLREVLAYDKRTGLFTWLVTLNHRGRAGFVAGHIRSDGYRVIGIDGQTYLAHRLAWLYVAGEWPEHEIDHRNNTPGDDRWTNLRDATRSQNKANVRPPRSNTSGFKGVTWNKKDRRWRAQIKVGGKHRILGGYHSKAEARAAYKVEASRVFGEFARAA